MRKAAKRAAQVVVVVSLAVVAQLPGALGGIGVAALLEVVTQDGARAWWRKKTGGG